MNTQDRVQQLKKELQVLQLEEETGLNHETVQELSNRLSEMDLCLTTDEITITVCDIIDKYGINTIEELSQSELQGLIREKARVTFMYLANEYLPLCGSTKPAESDNEASLIVPCECDECYRQFLVRYTAKKVGTMFTGFTQEYLGPLCECDAGVSIPFGFTTMEEWQKMLK